MKYLEWACWVSMGLLSLCICAYGVGYIIGMIECNVNCEG